MGDVKQKCFKFIGGLFFKKIQKNKGKKGLPSLLNCLIICISNNFLNFVQ